MVEIVENMLHRLTARQKELLEAENPTFSRDEMGKLLDLAEAGVATLVAAQKAAVA